MKLLLDTHALMWWLEDDPRLGPRARQRLADPDNEVIASIVSLWEIALKWRVGKMHLPGSAFAPLLDEQGVALLTVERPHIEALEGLAFHHGDPFDHLILAQAVAEGATVMTKDRQMAQYGVPCIGVS
jgi:PIN domain nuclease of toxin-antitoxin system